MENKRLTNDFNAKKYIIYRGLFIRTFYVLFILLGSLFLIFLASFTTYNFRIDYLTKELSMLSLNLLYLSREIVI